MSNIGYSRAAALSKQAEGQMYFHTGKTVNATKASRTAVAEDTTSVSTAADSVLQIGSVLCRDPYGWDHGIGVDYARPATAVLHEQKVVCVAVGNREYPDTISTDGPGRWFYGVDMSGEVNVLIKDSGISCPTTGADGSFLGVTNGSFALVDLDIPVAGGTITDSSGGAAGATISANAAKVTIVIPIGAGATLASAQTFGVAVPFAYSIPAGAGVGRVRAGVAITTGGKAATFQIQIGGVSTTGGVATVVTLATGVASNLTSVTAGGTGTAGQVLSLLTSTVTAFSEGTLMGEVDVINTDLANALATFAAAENGVKKALNIGVGIPLDPALSSTNLSGTAAAVKRVRFCASGLVKTMP